MQKHYVSLLEFDPGREENPVKPLSVCEELKTL